MKINVVATGSSGNCYCIENNGHVIFVDAGAAVRDIKSILDDNESINETSLFITHEHSDHIKGLVPLINKYNPKIYTSRGTAEVLLRKGVRPEILYPIESNTNYDFKDFSVRAFNTIHDAAQPFGFRFDFGTDIFSIATDFGVVDDYLLKSLEGSNVMIVESNYEEELLKRNNKYPLDLKKRILSKLGHLSNKDAFYLVGEMGKRGLKKCFLAHVSENSNDYDLLENYAKSCNSVHDVDAKVLRQKTRYKHDELLGTDILI